jgi:hypothetical protein
VVKVLGNLVYRCNYRNGNKPDTHSHSEKKYRFDGAREILSYFINLPVIELGGIGEGIA